MLPGEVFNGEVLFEARCLRELICNNLLYMLILRSLSYSKMRVYVDSQPVRTTQQ